MSDANLHLRIHLEKNEVAESQTDYENFTVKDT